MQRMILGLLNGTETPMVYTVSDRWTTAELVDELVKCNLLDETRHLRSLLATVHRACRSLERRKLIEGVYERDWSNGAEIAVGWSRKDA